MKFHWKLNYRVNLHYPPFWLVKKLKKSIIFYWNLLWANPGHFLFFRLQRDLNMDFRSRRQARWPINNQISHWYTQKLKLFSNKVFLNLYKVVKWVSREYALLAIHSDPFFKKWAIPGLFFLYYRLLNTVVSKQMFNKFWQWLDSNRRPLIPLVSGNYLIVCLTHVEILF